MSESASDVDGLDFLSWQRTFESTTDLAADGDNDGAVTGLDLDIWRERFGLALAGPAFHALDAVMAELHSEPGSALEQRAINQWSDAWRGAWLTPEPLSNDLFHPAQSDAAFRPRREDDRVQPHAARDTALQRWLDATARPFRRTAAASQPPTTPEHDAGDPTQDLRQSGAEFDAAISLLLG